MTYAALARRFVDIVTPERAVIQAFVAGEPHAVRELYRRYARPMYAVAYRSLGDRGLAEEAVQQAFLQAWRAATRLDPDRDVAPWLFTIVRRVAVDLYRRERRHRNQEPLESEIAELPPGFEHAWTAWEVRRGLEALPEEERTVLYATHFMGLTHEDAAEQLRIPVGTVKSRSFRAYRKLAALLAHLDEGQT